MSSRPRQLRLELLVDTHAARRQSIIEQLVRAILGIWSTFDKWYDDDLMNVAAGRAGMLAMIAAREMRKTDLAFTKAVFGEYGLANDDLGDIEDVYPRSGVSAIKVHRRPALQYRYAVSKGQTDFQAMEAALERAKAIAETDVRVAGRDESHRIYQNERVAAIGWRRILHPELSRTGPCGLCVVASDRFYKTSELEEIHDLCVCGKLPVILGDDPGQRINQADLERIYAAAEGNTAEDLKNVRVAVRENGEIGPVLVREGDHFRDAAEAGGTPYSPPTLEEHRANLLEMKGSLVGSAERLQQRLDTMAPDDPDRLTVQSAIRRNHDTLAALDRRLLSN